MCVCVCVCVCVWGGCQDSLRDPSRTVPLVAPLYIDQPHCVLTCFSAVRIVPRTPTGCWVPPTLTTHVHVHAHLPRICSIADHRDRAALLVSGLAVMLPPALREAVLATASPTEQQQQQQQQAEAGVGGGGWTIEARAVQLAMLAAAVVLTELVWREREPGSAAGSGSGQGDLAGAALLQGARAAHRPDQCMDRTAGTTLGSGVLYCRRHLHLAPNSAVASYCVASGFLREPQYVHN